MNAGRLLRETGFDTAALRVRIAPVNPDQINLWPASRLFQRFWRDDVKAVTQGKFVFVDPELLNGGGERLARLVVHELIHVRQYMATGYLRFVVGYLEDYWLGRIGGRSPREAYLNISYEREARDLTAKTFASV